MSAGALGGLAALNLAFLLAGGSVVWAVAGLPSWSRVAELAGGAYLVGLACSGVAWTLLLVAGVPLGGAAMLGVVAAVAVAGGAAGVVRRSPLPHAPRVRPPALLDVVGLGVAIVLLEAIFRAGRLAGLYTWDAWAFWVPKAKIIYLTGGLDTDFFTRLPGPTYPPLVPALEAADFHAMASMDVVTLHVQFWFCAVGFVAAVVGLLWRRVHHALLWTFVLAALAAPRVGEHVLKPQADFLLDFLFVTGALLVLLWLLEDDRAHLLLATPLLAATVLTKREGVLLVACLAVATAVAAGGRLRRAWWIVGLPFAVAAAVTGIWHAWYAAHGIGGEVAAGGGLAAGLGLDRAVDALRLSLQVFFDPGLWGLVPFAGVVALAAALAMGVRRPAMFALVLVTLIVLGGAWVTWSYRELAISTDDALNPIVRYTTSIELLLAVLAPLLVSSLVPERIGEVAAHTVRPARAALLAGALALAYPVAALAHGLPRFPDRGDCVRAPVEGQPVAVVFGRFDTLRAADALAQRAEHVGFQGLRIEQDGCGRLVVWLPNAPDVKTGESVVAEARGARFETHLELGHG